MFQNQALKGFLLVVLLLLPACYSTSWLSPTSTPALPLAASIQFTGGATDLGGTAWMEDQALEFGIQLGLGGVYALNHTTAFLYGGVGVPAGTLHSILLRSTRGRSQMAVVRLSVENGFFRCPARPDRYFI